MTRLMIFTYLLLIAFHPAGADNKAPVPETWDSMPWPTAAV